MKKKELKLVLEIIVISCMAGLGIVITYTSEYLNVFSNVFPSPLPILIGLLVSTFMIIRVEAQYHAYLIEDKNTYINHNLAWGTRIFFTVLLIELIYIKITNYTYWDERLVLATVLACWWGIVFNYTLNTTRGKPALYVSKSRDRPSRVDKIFSKFKHPGEYLLLTELIVGILAGIFYSYLVKHRA